MTLVVVGRDKLPPGKSRLGRWGYLVNWTSIIYCCVTTVFFFFPDSPNPSATDMNYAIGVLGLMLVVSVIFWCVKGKKTYLKTDGAMSEIIRAQHLLPAAEQIHFGQLRYKSTETEISR